MSSLSAFERNAPLIRWIEGTVQSLDADSGLDETVRFSSAAYSRSNDVSEAEYTFKRFMWAPIKTRDGKVFAGVLITREIPWTDREDVLANRLLETYGHAWLALTKRPLGKLSKAPVLALRLALIAAITALAFVPVPITTIAPVEAVGRDATVVSSPLQGVIDEIAVEPNQVVAKGDLLFRIEDTELRNAASIATQNVLVAKARVEQLESGSIIDPAARRELVIARAELELAEAELDLAQERLSRVEVRAASAGIATFSSVQEWIGKPVTIGEKIMEVADPDRIDFFIPLPVGDLIVLDEETNVRVFLDSDPLAPVRAEIVSASYHATLQPNGTLAYQIYAEPPEELEPPRIGSRGAAQILGQNAPLYFVLFRRPIAWFRQTFGV